MDFSILGGETFEEIAASFAAASVVAGLLRANGTYSTVDLDALAKTANGGGGPTVRKPWNGGAVVTLPRYMFDEHGKLGFPMKTPGVFDRRNAMMGGSATAEFIASKEGQHIGSGKMDALGEYEGNEREKVN